MSIKNKIIKWSEKDLFEPSYFMGTDIIDELICFLNYGRRTDELIISDGFKSGAEANLLIISGFINHKNYELLKLKYSKLKGKKYVLSAGFMSRNQLGFPTYNQANLNDGFIHVNEYIEGPNPTREDILRGILRLQE